MFSRHPDVMPPHTWCHFRPGDTLVAYVWWHSSTWCRTWTRNNRQRKRWTASERPDSWRSTPRLSSPWAWRRCRWYSWRTLWRREVRWRCWSSTSTPDQHRRWRREPRPKRGRVWRWRWSHCTDSNVSTHRTPRSRSRCCIWIQMKIYSSSACLFLILHVILFVQDTIFY